MPIWQVPHPRDPEVQPAGLVLECGQAGSRSTVRVGFTLLTLTRGFVGVGGGGGGGYEWVGFSVATRYYLRPNCLRACEPARARACVRGLPLRCPPLPHGRRRRSRRRRRRRRLRRRRGGQNFKGIGRSVGRSSVDHPREREADQLERRFPRPPARALAFPHSLLT